MDFGEKLGKTAFPPMLEAGGAYLPLEDVHAVRENTSRGRYSPAERGDVLARTSSRTTLSPSTARWSGHQADHVPEITCGSSRRCPRRQGRPAPGASSPCSPAPTASTTPPAPACGPALSPEILVVRNLTANGLLAESADALARRPSRHSQIDHSARRLLRRRRA